VWIPSPDDDTVYKMLTKTGEVIPISVGQRPRQLAVGVGGRVYVTSFNSNEVFALDQERSRVVGEPVTVAVNPFGLAAGAGSVWVGSLPDETLTELATGRVG
jgi:DNA-binding beta-propeller fold protein YncE